MKKKDKTKKKAKDPNRRVIDPRDGLEVFALSDAEFDNPMNDALSKRFAEMRGNKKK